jgi:CBS domain containing-hemolysin-like protein
LDIHWHFRIILLLVLFFFSAFFSGSEVALFSLDKRKLKNNPDIKPFIWRYILYLIDHPRRLLVTVLLGNTIVNVAASIIAVSLALDILSVTEFSREFILTLQIIVLTVLIIIFSELTPKIWAAKNPLTVAKLVSIPLYLFSVIIYPVAEIISEFIRLFISKIKFDY